MCVCGSYEARKASCVNDGAQVDVWEIPKGVVGPSVVPPPPFGRSVEVGPSEGVGGQMCRE